MQGRVTPETVTKLETDQIFVFPSNMQGIHGAGAALVARKLFDAELGIGEGPTGRCYALPTKRAPYVRAALSEVREAVFRFLIYSAGRLNQTFLVCEIVAGFRPSQIAPMFIGALDLHHIWLPASFWRVLSPARTGTQDFAEHLRHASSVVRTWPNWKQQVLGASKK